MESLINQVAGSVGEVKQLYTMVDFYSYIKALEYLICIGFFVGFPAFFRYINKSDEEAEA